jgi:hypothetical protein
METKKFIERAEKIHGNTYDYSLVELDNCKSKAKIKCHQHGVFEQIPYTHLEGKGCPNCGKNKRKCDFKLEAELIHGNKYDYSSTNYINWSTKVNVNCLIHGEFMQLPEKHLTRKQGCPKCGITSIINKLTKTTDNFITKAKLIHGDKYDYSLTNYTGSNKKVKIKCDIHAVFNQTPHNHLKGNGCPICRESVGEKQIRQFLITNEIKFIRQYKFNDCRNILPLPFDFYLPEHNMCIEFQGRQHYIPVKQFGGVSGFAKTKIINNKTR